MLTYTGEVRPVFSGIDQSGRFWTCYKLDAQTWGGPCFVQLQWVSEDAVGTYRVLQFFANQLVTVNGDWDGDLFVVHKIDRIEDRTKAGLDPVVFLPMSAVPAVPVIMVQGYPPSWLKHLRAFGLILLGSGCGALVAVLLWMIISFFFVK
ncbi:MAG: hypothetical protein AAB408_00460 [Patescibacteria group bacterium]